MMFTLQAFLPVLAAAAAAAAGRTSAYFLLAFAPSRATFTRGGGVGRP